MKNYKILIVDDDTRILKLLQKLLQKNNFIVSTASSPVDALKMFKKEDFDLLILDIMMPNITGIEFAKKIRSQKDNTPIVMLTALSEDQDIQKGLAAGANEYITKPFDSDNMILRLNNLLKLRNDN